MMVALAGAEALFQGRPDELREYVDPECRQIAAKQAAIGWANMLKGRLSKSWSACQSRHLRQPAKDPSKWSKDLALFMLQQFLLLWKSRNEDRHGRDQASRREAEHSKVVSAIEYYYARADCVPPEVANVVFRRSLRALTGDMVSVMKAWLENWSALILPFLRRQPPAAPIVPGLLVGRPPD